MAVKSERAKVEVIESSTPGVRTFNITLTARASDFQLTDLLRQRGVIKGIDSELNRAVKEAFDGYLKSAEKLISSLASTPIGRRSSHSNSNNNKDSNSGT